MNRGAQWATVHGVAKELDTAYQLNNNTHTLVLVTKIKYAYWINLETHAQKYKGKIQSLPVIPPLRDKHFYHCVLSLSGLPW